MSRVLRGRIFGFSGQGLDTFFEEKGAIAIDAAGRIAWLGQALQLPIEFQSAPLEDYGDHLLMAGFIDAHIHFPQLRVLAAPASDLLDWLRRVTFPEEARFGDPEVAIPAASQFLNFLFSYGTTAAAAFCSVHKICAQALFMAAQDCNMALISGKTMMDRNALPSVQDTVETAARDSEALYHQFHGKYRLRYAVTPRFAITSSDAQLRSAGELLRSLPGALMQTHLSESVAEMADVKRLFPAYKDYTSVYEHFGLVTERSLFAHGVHLSEPECQMLHEAGATVVHCPTSNNFLGSGLMPMAQLQKKSRPVALGVATDVGGGTSYSMLATLAETYKVQMLTGTRLSAIEMLHLATLGNAKALKIDHETGSLALGKFADIIVVDPQATPILAARQSLSQSLEDMLFAIILLGDERVIRATYVAGRKVHCHE